MNRTPVLFGIVMLLVLALLSGCRSCSHSDVLAKLESKQGEVSRNEAGQGKDWNLTNIGAAFRVGDALRTAHAAEALLGLDGGGKLRVRQDTVIRFQNRRPASKHKDFDVESGQVLLEAGERELLLETNVGLARIEANGRVLIRKTEGGLAFDVTVGRARFESGDEARTVESGQTYTINVGNAVVEPSEPRDAGAVREAKPAAVDASVAAPADAVEGGVLARVTGNGVSQKGPSDPKFKAISPGTTQLRNGATVRVEAGSSVELQRGGAKVALSGAGTYQVKGEKDSLVEVLNGNLAISGPTRIVVPGGVIETNDQAAAAVETLGKQRTRVRVSQGTATLVGAKGSTKVSTGEQATLSRDGSTKLEGRGLTYADVTADAGESFVIHDPKPPTAVRFLFGSRCNAGATIRIKGGQFASGDSSAALALGPGRHDYALYCLSDRGPATTAAARGTMTILRDAGTRPVPTTPPSTSVTIDGRNYTVMYQNQLPSVTVVWPNAPTSSSYRLTVEARGGTKTYTSSTPNYSFRSGILPEGHHTIYFEGGGRVSRHTGVEISFDNAAPMASLFTPVDPELGTGGDLTITGVAQPGWQVEIGGDKVAQDGQQRFSQRLQMPTTERAVSVKLIHPSRGVHVYLRRAARTHD